MRFLILLLSFSVQSYVLAGETISFKTSDHRYLVAENGGGDAVNANRIEIGAWERFYVVHLTGNNFSDGSRICIRTHSGNYLTAENYDIVANRTICAAWEEFIVERRGDRIALKTWQNRYVVAHDGWVLADRIEIGDWEKFTIVH